MSLFKGTFGHKEKCYYCGQPEICTKDHFYPKSRGGNVIIWACAVCQGSKKDMMPEEWVVYVKNHVAFTPEIKVRIENCVYSLIRRFKVQLLQADAIIRGRKAIVK